MANIIVVFPKIEDAKNIRNLLVRYGFSVSAVCTTGAQAISTADGLDDGIVAVIGFRICSIRICMRICLLILRCCWWHRRNI